MEILYGVHPVAEALRARRRRLLRLHVRKGRGGREVARLLARAADLGVPVEEEPEASFRRLAPPDANTQGILLEAGPLPILGLDELVAAARQLEGERSLILVALDGVEDPQNLGAIARVAEAAGAGGLILTERRAPPLGPAVARASAGAIESLPVARVPNLGGALDHLKERGFWIFGADPEAPEELFSLPDHLFRGDACVVFGAEGRGLRPGIRRRVDHALRVPMAGRVASLNVAASAAVVLYEWLRRLPGRTAGTP